MKQSESYAITHVTLNQIDHGLKEIVDTQQKYLSSRIDQQLVKFKENRHHDKSYAALSNRSLTQEQVSVEQFEKRMDRYTSITIHFSRLIPFFD
jgi:hypothetical protein